MSTSLDGTRLTTHVRRGLAWSTLSNLALRTGGLVVGVVLARLLTPEQFGVYAVALAVQVVLMTLADLGLGVDLVRTDDPDRIAPTVATVGLLGGAVLSGLMVLSAHPLAHLLGSPESGTVIAMLAATVLLAAAGVVPYAMLCRRFQQRTLFMIALVDFAVSTVLTIGLVQAGYGIISLAIGRIAAQTVTLVLQFVLSGTRPRYAFDRDIARSVLRFGVPIATANMLSWALLNIDTIVIAKIAGPMALGFYFLAFNVSSWPMSAIGQIARSVALPAFARIPDRRGDTSLAVGVALAWALALPAGALLAALAVPLINAVYGPTWQPAAQVLAALGLFGALRVVFDMMAAYLLARGASGAVLRIQVIWFVTLIPAMIAGTHWFGIAGGGWAHLVVALAITLPTYVVAARRSGADIRRLMAVLWPPVVAAVPASLAGFAMAQAFEAPVVALLTGGVVGAVVYLALIFRWLRSILLTATRPDTSAPVPATRQIPLGAS